MGANNDLPWSFSVHMRVHQWIPATLQLVFFAKLNQSELDHYYPFSTRLAVYSTVQLTNQSFARLVTNTSI